MSEHPLLVFTARAEARALLVYAGEYDAQAAVDELLDDAWKSGLADQFGNGVLFAIVAAAFSKYEGHA